MQQNHSVYRKVLRQNKGIFWNCYCGYLDFEIV